MAAPSTPTNYFLQAGNNQVYLLWDLMSGATSYSVQRSTDGITFTTLAAPATPYYLDTSVVTQTIYYYQVASVNGSGTSPYTTSQSIIPVLQGQKTLQQIRLMAQQKADRVNSKFVTLPEWNSFINQAAFELYDLLMNVYEDYFVKAPFTFQTDGTTIQYNLNTLIPDFFKLQGVDCGLGTTSNAWVTLKKFDFISRNRYVYPSITSTFLGVFNLRYRIMGGPYPNPTTLMFIPTPSAGQFIRIWYYPRMLQLLQETDILDSMNGWDQYVIVRAAKYALDKEESDTGPLSEELLYLKGRIEESAPNRDIGQSDTISATRNYAGGGGEYGEPGSDGGFGGY